MLLDQTDVFVGILMFMGMLSIHILNGRYHILAGLEDIEAVGVNTIYYWEERGFGFHPTEQICSFTHPLLDALASIPYLCHYVIPFGFPAYLFITNRVRDISRFYWLLGASCLGLCVVWSLFPVVPPWALKILVESLGQGMSAASPMLKDRIVDSLRRNPELSLASILVHKEGSAFRRIDSRTGHAFFHGLFSGNTVPFAAFPSGHLAWTTTMYVVGAPGGRFFGFYVGWLAWATMYSHHHYIIDAVAGITFVFLCDKLLKIVSRAYRSNFVVHTRIVTVTQKLLCCSSRGSHPVLRSVAVHPQPTTPIQGLNAKDTAEMLNCDEEFICFLEPMGGKRCGSGSSVSSPGSSLSTQSGQAPDEPLEDVN